MSILGEIAKKPERILPGLASRIVSHCDISDENAVKLLYFANFRKKMSFEEPHTFNEKIQWLKVNDHNPIYPTLVDKLSVKEWVANRIGEKYIVPTYGIWDSFDDITFQDLPMRFVLKTNHDSGGIVICRDKSMFNADSARRVINRSLSADYSMGGREWPYKKVDRKVFAEKFIEGETVENREGIIDYKFYCFDGVPKFLYVSHGLECHDDARMVFLDLEWRYMGFKRPDYREFETVPAKPPCFSEMIEIAQTLSAGRTFVRVDLFQDKGATLFSELTLYPCSGLMAFEPAEWDLRCGQMLDLSAVKNDTL